MAANSVADYCSPEIFRRGLTVQESAPGLLEINTQIVESQMLFTGSAEERARYLADLREQRQRVRSIYYLRYHVRRECVGMPREVTQKLLSDILETWARQSEEQRGVLNVRANTISPAFFDRAVASGESLLVRVNLVRTSVERVLNSITELEQLPGANLVRAGDERVGLAEARGRLEDLLAARIDPLLDRAAAATPDSARWLTGTLRTAMAELEASERSVEELRRALQDYGTGSAVPTQAARQTDSSQDATLVQMDRSFVDRLLELSDKNIQFRQDLTQRVIVASAAVVTRLGEVAHYRGLLEASQRGGGGDAAQLESRLQPIAEAAKVETKLVQDLYTEFSRSAFRVSSAMYQVFQPAGLITTRSFSLSRLALTVFVAVLLAPFLVGVIIVFSDYLRGLARDTSRS